MNSTGSSFYQALIEYTQNNTGTILLNVVFFILIVVLFLLYLSQRITKESSKSALDMAEASKKKSEEVGKKIDNLNVYLRDVFRKEFGGAMESFDSTVSSVLQEMKNELSQSISNIERIESSVKSRKTIDMRIEEGGEKARALLDNKK